MARHRRKKRPNRGKPVAPARRRKFVPIAATLLGLGVLAVVAFLNLSGCQPDTAKTGAKSGPVATTRAEDSSAPVHDLVQAGETSKPAAPSAAVPPAAVETADRRASVSDAKRGFDVLKGKWLRPDSDGRYVVEVKSVDESGKMDASYFNPKRINVSKAEASRDGATTKVFIELRDVNYPGSTYNLSYEPKSDELRGIYYQAALQQSFEVIFLRMP